MKLIFQEKKEQIISRISFQLSSMLSKISPEYRYLSVVKMTNESKYLPYSLAKRIKLCGILN